MRLDSKPTLRHLDELICCQIGSNWDQLALHLGVEQCVIDAVKEDHRHCEQACRDVLNRWLSSEHGTGGQRRTWRSILTALRECGDQELAGRLKTEWFI